MPRPSVAAALAVLVCSRALWLFASGELSFLGLALRYLGALVVVSVALAAFGRVWSAYAKQPPEGPPEGPEGPPSRGPAD